MGSSNSFKEILYCICSHCGWISSLLLVLLGIVIGLDTASESYENWPNAAIFVVDWIKKSSLWIIVVLAAMAVMHGLYRRLVNPWVGKKLKFILDGFQKKAYADFRGQREHRNRVTLFKFKRFILFRRHWSGQWKWPYGKGKKPFDGWLVPILRSGHKSPTKTVFHAPTSSDSEGVAGVVWDAQEQISTSTEEVLPNITRQSGSAQRRKYAKRSFTEEKFVDYYLDQGKPLPRSIGAIPIFVNNERWGVLVLDSQEPEGVTEDVLSNFSLTAEIIGQLLEKA